VKFWLSLSVAFIAIAAITPASSQVPQWAVSHKITNYPAGEYILGVGQGTGEKADETAKRLARSDIAAQVRVKVQTEIKNIQQTYGLNPNQESYADFKINSTSVVGEELTGAVIVETAIDTSTSTTYALAALNKEKFSVTIAAGLTEGWNHAKKLQRAAEDFLRQGKITEAIQDFVEAQAGAMELLPKLALHDALARAPFRIEPSLGPSALASSVRDALSSVRIEKRGGDKQKGKIGENFSEPFIVQVTANEGQNSVPVAGAAIVFLNSSGEQFGEAITDAKGMASCSMKARGTIGQQLRARLSLPSLGKEFSSSLNSSSTVFNCVLLDADVAFSVKIDVRSSKVSDALRSVVVDAVMHAGYHIVDMSRFMLRVGFQSTPPATVEGADGTLYSVSSEVTMVLIDKDSNRTLGSIVGKSQGVAKSQDGALEQSARGVKLDVPEFVSLLEKAKN
jgi:hypothetical protein